MKKLAVILANGYEETEAITIIDVARRANIEVCAIGLNDLKIISKENVILTADKLFKDVKFDEFDAIALPGGLQSTRELASNNEIIKILKLFDSKNKLIAAICAAPIVLKSANLIKNSFTCYPGLEGEISKQTYKNDKNVILDKNILTSKGPATAMEFSLEIVKILLGDEVYKSVKNELLF